MSTLILYGQFTSSNAGATGLTVTVTVKKIAKSGGAITTVASAGTAVTGELFNGIYYYTISSADLTLYDYIAAFTTTGTADQKDVPAAFAQYGVQSDVAAIAGTSQTARDLGASVLLSSGTGTGQLDITSGVVKANWVQILGSAITGTASQLAAAVTKFFNVATPTGTVNSLPDAVPGASGGVVIAGSNAATTFATLTVTGAFSINGTGNVAQTGDSFARIGAPTGASIAADIQTRLATSGYTVPPTVIQIRTEMDSNSTKLANLDATVSSRMATYTQPTGFLAATFPSGTIASTTNITAGTIATVSGNVNGNVGGNVTGSVGSISGVTFPTNFSVLSISATTGLVTLAGTQTFNNTGTWTGNLTGSVNSVTTGVTLAAAAVQAIWDALTSALTTTGSIGKSLVTFLGNFANMISGTGTGTPKFTTSALSNAPTGGGGGSGLSGPSSVTLTFVDASTNPVPLVEFTLLSEDKSTAIGSARADSNGVATFGTDDGSYYVTAQATATVLFADAALSVSSTTAQTITGSSNIPTPSTTPSGCNVYDTAIGIDGAAKAGVEYHFRVTQAASGTRNGSEQTATSVGTGTNNIVMALTQGDTVAIKRGTAAQWETFTVPASTSAQLSDLLDEDAAVGKDGSTP